MTILGGAGAERLLGRGDFCFKRLETPSSAYRDIALRVTNGQRGAAWCD